jgi:hypothetical protein
VFVGQVMIASRCPRRPARAARWPHPQRAARALGPPRRWRVEARDAQRPGKTRRYRWGGPAPSVRCAPYSRHLQRRPRLHPQARRGRSGSAADKIDGPPVGAVGDGGWEGCRRGKGCGWVARHTDCGPRAPTGAAGRRWGFCCGAACCCRGCSHEPCRPDRCCWVIEARCRWSEQMIGYSAAVLIVLPGVERAREDASWRRGSPERP